MTVYLTVIILALSSMDRARITQDGIDRTVWLMPYIDKAAAKYHIPRWFLIGVLYNESNMESNPRGHNDNGRAFGLGQIHCGPGGFSWLQTLDQIGIKTCKELYNPDLNIEATAHIIAHIVKYEKRQVKGQPSWLDVATTYQKGSRWRKKGWSKSLPYYNRVLLFGKRLAVYRTSCQCSRL